MTSRSIDEAVREVRQGRLDAYREVIAACEARVRIAISMLLPDPAQVDDVSQEAFFQAYQKLSEYREGTDFAAWIREIARNLALNERRAWVRRQATTRRFKVKVEQSLERDLVDLAAGPQGEVFEALRGCVDRLESGVRQVVDRYYWQKMSCPAIAESLGRSTEWAWVVLHRARALIVRCLQTKGVLHGS